MAITDYGAVSSQIGGGTVGKNSMRNFTSEMDMSRNGLASVAKRKANAFQNEAIRETAKQGQAPASGGNWAAGVGQALSGLKGLMGQSGNNGYNSNAYGGGNSSWYDGSGLGFDTSIGGYGDTMVNTGFDLSGGSIFSDAAMDSIVSPDFGFSTSIF